MDNTQHISPPVTELKKSWEAPQLTKIDKNMIAGGASGYYDGGTYS